MIVIIDGKIKGYSSLDLEVGDIVSKIDCRDDYGDWDTTSGTVTEIYEDDFPEPPEEKNYVL